MNSMHSRCLEFIGSKAQELILEGVSVYLSNKTSINNKYGGTFSSYDKMFKVAMGSGDDSVFTFIHEYSHFLQFKHRPEFWNENFFNGAEIYLRWLDSGIIKGFEVEDVFSKFVTLEHDAQQIALSIVTSHSLPLNLAYCTKTANIHLLFLSWTRLSKTWNNGDFPKWHDGMTSKVPTELLPISQLTDMKQSKKILNKIGITNCFNKKTNSGKK